MSRKKKTMEFEPSVYQKAIFDFVEHGQGNAVIEAQAGSGKSWTLVKCLELMPKDAHILLTAFNNSIVNELKSKIKNLPNVKNIDCTTIHGLGYRMLKSNYGKKIQNVSDFKYTSYIYNNIEDIAGKIYSMISFKDKQKYVENLKKYINFGRYYLCQTVEDLTFIESRYNIMTIANEKEIALKILDWGKNNIETIDFTDMVWLPNVLNCKPYKCIYDWICIDESQDMEKQERELVLKCTKMSTRILAVGQKIQCQPEGTKVLLTDGEKNIENVKVGDKVISFNEETNNYDSCDAIEKIECHKERKFITIHTQNGLCTNYTPEHICYARFNDKYKTLYGIFLTCGNYNKYGLTILDFDNLTAYNTITNYAINTRKAKLWLLNICTNKSDADSICSILSFKYFLPSPHLMMNNSMYDRLGEKNMFEHVNDCLKQFNREYAYPLYDISNNSYGKNILACNLIPKYMDVITYIDGGINYDNIINIDFSTEDKEKNVYSLSINGNHNYIADGILTHNCINAWKGADDKSFEELKNMPNTICLPLSISYRCGKNIVKYANKFSPDMEPKPDAIDGEVKFNCKIDEINDGDMILCRTNAPLFQVYCDLVKEGKTAYIYGKDIGASLIKLIEKTKENFLMPNLLQKGVFPKLYDVLFSEIDAIMRFNKISFDMALEDDYISQACDKITALEIIADGCITANDLKKKIESLFSDENSKGIRLSTIHKAKGLECDNVYICCPSLLPLKSAKEPWQLQEEANLEYVAYTRAKQKLGFLDEAKYEKFGSSGQMKSSELQQKKGLIFKLYGNENRCGVIIPNTKAAKHIIENKTNVKIKPKNAVNIQSITSATPKSLSSMSIMKKNKKKIKRKVRN